MAACDLDPAVLMIHAWLDLGSDRTGPKHADSTIVAVGPQLPLRPSHTPPASVDWAVGSVFFSFFNFKLSVLMDPCMFLDWSSVGQAHF